MNEILGEDILILQAIAKGNKRLFNISAPIYC